MQVLKMSSAGSQDGTTSGCLVPLQSVVRSEFFHETKNSFDASTLSQGICLTGALDCYIPRSSNCFSRIIDSAKRVTAAILELSGFGDEWRSDQKIGWQKCMP